MKIDNSKVQVVSFSGGRTSAYMVYLIEQMRKSGEWTAPTEYIFMDTGAEHPETYEFIKKCVEYFGIKLTCLRGNFEQPVGEGHTYDVVDVADIKYDMKNGSFAQLMRKYGVPTVMSAWCTSRMKEETHDKYCNDKHGKGNYSTWLGIRYDEPKRLRIGNASGIRYMAEITDFEKEDVLDFWSGMPFDLQVEEHLGNCVFCIKKGASKVALAQRDEPEMFVKWSEVINHESVRLMPADKFGVGHIYRNWLSPEQLIAQFSELTNEELRERIYKEKKFDTGSCSESCEAFGDQLDMF